MRDALRAGASLDELWKVGKGDIKYADFMQQQSRGSKGPRKPEKDAPQAPEELVQTSSSAVNILRTKLPDRAPQGTSMSFSNDRMFTMQVGIQAYILWEKAGRPDGADFATDARRALQDQLDKGATIEHLEKSLKAPSPKEPELAKEAAAPSPPSKPAEPKQQETQVSLNTSFESGI